LGGIDLHWGMSSSAEDRGSELSAEQVRKIAALSKLAVTDTEVEELRGRLGAVVGYVDRLRGLDLTGVEPLVHVGDTMGTARPDEPGPNLSRETLMAMAPETAGGYVKIPRVLGGSGGGGA